MKFKRVYLEKDLGDNLFAQNIVKHFPNLPVIEIDKYDNYFGKFRKSYLNKRHSLDLFIARKKGLRVKKAPEAYGNKGSPHYYFVHAYNCVYECEYCYLQSYFKSPDIVLFVNHEEIQADILEIYKKESLEHSTVCFHAGEFSDSLALSHISGELKSYFEFFQKLPKARLEFRTKSSNIKALLKLEAPSNVVISYSLSSENNNKDFDHKTPSSTARLKAIAKLQKHGYKIAIHLDPIILTNTFKEDYRKLIQDISSTLEIENIEHLSLGVPRFSKEAYKDVFKHYPKSKLQLSPFKCGSQGKYRYSDEVKDSIFDFVKRELLSSGFSNKQLYLCMDDNEKF